jgi:hypothetical protein
VLQGGRGYDEVWLRNFSNRQHPVIEHRPDGVREPLSQVGPLCAPLDIQFPVRRSLQSRDQIGACPFVAGFRGVIAGGRRYLFVECVQRFFD